MTIVGHRAWEFDRPLVLVGFPSQGLVGAIVASYLVPKLDMELVATLEAPYLPPIASVHKGKALSPIQFFASAKVCGIDGTCSQLVVVRSDAVPLPQHADALARELLEWAKLVKASLVVSLEGVSSASATDAVYAVTNLFAELDAKRLGAEAFNQGTLAGVSAALLVQGNVLEVPVACLFTGVEEDMPDSAAAARLVGVADVLVPGIKMDAKPLEEEARAHETAIRALIEEQRRSMASDEQPMMYG